MIVYFSNICKKKYWEIFLGVGNQSEMFTLKLMGILFQNIRIFTLRKLFIKQITLANRWISTYKKNYNYTVWGILCFLEIPNTLLQKSILIVNHLFSRYHTYEP